MLWKDDRCGIVLVMPSSLAMASSLAMTSSLVTSSLGMTIMITVTTVITMIIIIIKPTVTDTIQAGRGRVVFLYTSGSNEGQVE